MRAWLLVANDLGVREDVVGGRHAQRELAEERDAADRVELAGLLDLVLERDDVDRPRGRLEVADRLEHDLVPVIVEVVDLERVELRAAPRCARRMPPRIDASASRLCGRTR